MSMNDINEYNNCLTWLTNPQFAPLPLGSVRERTKYDVGNPKEMNTWMTLYNTCSKYFEEFYTKNYTPYKILNMAILISQNKNIIDIDTVFKKSLKLKKPKGMYTDVFEVHESIHLKKLLSSCIVAYGILLSGITNTNIKEVVPQNKEPVKESLKMIYSHVYEYHNKKYALNERIIVLPEDFLSLSWQHTKSTKTKSKTKKYKCKTDLIDVCEQKFSQIQNQMFKNLVNDIICNCSFLKTKIVYNDSKKNTLSTTNYKTITSEDYKSFQNNFGYRPIVTKEDGNRYYKPLPIIAIRKYKDNIECTEKDYLYQLFSKFVENNIHKIPEEDKIINNHKTYINDLQGVYYNNIKSGRDRHPLVTSIFDVIIEPIVDNISNKISLMPVYFVNENNTVIFDPYLGPSKQFFNAVIEELFTHNILECHGTCFENSRYVINSEIDIAKIPFFKKILNKKNKEDLTHYFYVFLGNLLHFAVVNNLELPQKISRVYLIELLKLYDFTKSDDFNKTLLISIFLIERPPSYVDYVIKFLEQPNETNKQTLIEMTEYIDNSLKDIKLENINEESIIKYLFDIANLFYYGTETSNKRYFITGLNHYINSSIYARYSKNDSNNQLLRNISIVHREDNNIKLALIRKLDYYLTGGTGINFDSIVNKLLPQIKILTDTQKYNITQPFIDYIKQLSDKFLYTITNQTNIASKIVTAVACILMDRGKNISDLFKTKYNETFKPLKNNEDYHNEFVRLLLKAWTASPNISIGKEYIIYIDINQENKTILLPASHTCFSQLDIFKDYTSVKELYDDLVLFILNTGFGEDLKFGGGSKK